MALADSARAAKKWFAALPVAMKALMVGIAALALGGVVFWAANSWPATPTPEPVPAPASVSATNSAPHAAETSTVATATLSASETASATAASKAEQKDEDDGSDSDTKSSSDSDSESSKSDADKKPSTSLTESTIGLSTAERKAIALRIIAMEKKATEEADAKYPTDPEQGGSADNFEKNQEYWGELDQQYKAEIMEEFDIDLEQLIFVMIIDVSQYM